MKGEHLVVLLAMVVGGLNVALAIAAVWQAGHFHDFGVFYASARDWWTAPERAYDHPNLNTPIFVLLTSPLAALGLSEAWVLWQAVNVATLAVTVRIVLRETGTRWSGVLLAAIALHASTAAQVQLGQVAWLLGLPLALAWAAWRKGQPRRAGAWVAPVLAIKPFLLPVVIISLVSRSWRTLVLVSVAIALAITGAVALMIGPNPYREYLALAPDAWQSVYQPTSGSLTALLVRLGSPPALSLVLASLLWIPVLIRRGRLDRDRRWLAALATVLLVNPLGWVHYQAWLLPPIVAVVASGRWNVLMPIGIAIGCVPPVAAAAVPALQPAYLVGLLALWGAAMVSER